MMNINNNMKKISIILISAILLTGGIAGALNAFASDNDLLNENLNALIDDVEPSWLIECYKTITTTGNVTDKVRFCANCEEIYKAEGLDYGGKGKCIPVKNTEIQ